MAHLPANFRWDTTETVEKLMFRAAEEYVYDIIFLYIIMQLSRLNWWDDFIKLTEDTKYIDWEDQPGDPDPHSSGLYCGDPLKLHRIAIYSYITIPSK